MFTKPQPMLALAPMQDITDLPFWRLMAGHGGADVYYTEYFRVYRGSVLNRHILRSVTENPTGKPVVAQMIGNEIPDLVRTARELQEHPIAAVDLNLGCPAPIVYRKCAGGGLLRHPKQIDSILGALRGAIQKTAFTVKTRIGFDNPKVFEELLPIFARHNIDLLTVHARTVAEKYRSEVHYEYVARAVEQLPCPVLANGNVYSAQKAKEVLQITGARGLMIGRGAIRNPWIFTQTRQLLRGEPVYLPKGREVLRYISQLFDAVYWPGMSETSHVQRIKKYMNFIGLGVEPTGAFLHAIRRASGKEEFFRICAEFLEHDNAMPLEPFAMELQPTDVMAGVQD